MSLALIINGIISISKILPYISKAYDLFTEKWLDYKISKIKETIVTRRTKRVAILNAIKAAKTNEERKALSIILHDFNIGKLSNSNS